MSVLSPLLRSDRLRRKPVVAVKRRYREKYVDLDHIPKEVPLDRVDRAVSAELNRQRGRPFPPAF